jgi:hypothetical protein
MLAKSLKLKVTIYLAPPHVIDNSLFSISAETDIENSGMAGWEWVSIMVTQDSNQSNDDSTLANESYDYFRFLVINGQEFIFDIGYGYVVGTEPDDIDTFLRLFDESEVQLAFNDDSPLDNGSVNIEDSRIYHTFDYDGL